MLIELDVFSGRPNPRWQLDAPTTAQLIEIQRRLEPTSATTAEPPGVGYRGFRYTLDENEWRAWNRTISGVAGVLLDPDRSIERLLLDRLPSEYEDVRLRLTTEISADP
jgi:hypothetical protein